ncbi:MAG: hypothetical protein CMH75_05515 [Nitrospina sp.]|nr:hypothetical protein [Nitrospina sp.]|tara:strand:- start:4490 stop:4846 length:357 start_codon:yes stop_codon:yes gene_type:complete
MERSSSRFKALAITAGFSFWFFIISNSFGLFSLEIFLVFIILTITVTQIFAVKLSKGLDILAIVNTKIFLGILFIFVISVYGLIFRLLRIDPLRLKQSDNSYWLEMEHLKLDRIFKQY